mmetsp:Transcript_37891/g.68245  ORF Transcript_37891/g.68245 Transcript_37891/m.68245 type:complete len:259 (+) Transcript_37891:110-886(+)
MNPKDTHKLNSLPPPPFYSFSTLLSLVIQSNLNRSPHKLLPIQLSNRLLRLIGRLESNETESLFTSIPPHSNIGPINFATLTKVIFEILPTRVPREVADEELRAWFGFLSTFGSFSTITATVTTIASTITSTVTTITSAATTATTVTSTASTATTTAATITATVSTVTALSALTSLTSFSALSTFTSTTTLAILPILPHKNLASLQFRIGQLLNGIGGTLHGRELDNPASLRTSVAILEDLGVLDVASITHVILEVLP